MTQTEALKLALEALEPEFYLAEWYVNEHVIPAAIAAIKTVLAQTEQKHDYRTRYDRGCYKCGGHYCPADCPEPAHLVPKQPEPVATNNTSQERVDETAKQRHEPEPVAKVIDWGIEGPRLKGLTKDWPRVGTLLYACPPQEQQSCDKRKPLTDEQIIGMYNEPRSDAEMLEFARAIEAAHGIKGET